MSYKMRVKELRLKWELANRSWFVTENMTSATPDTAAWTTFKNVLVNENGEFVVKSTAAWVITEVYRQATAPTSPVTGWLWVDTSWSWEVLKQYNGTTWSELDHLSVSTITADATIWDSPTLLIVDGNSLLPINATLPAPNTAKWRRIEVYKYRWASAVTLTTPSWTIVNQFWVGALTYVFKNTNPNYFMTIRSDGANWIVDDDNIYNRVANTLYVDLDFGNNTYAVREFESRPFATVAAAIAASLPWDNIVWRNWEYAIWNIVLPHSLNFILEDWANWASWALWVPAWATVKFNWWTCYRTGSNSNLFVVRWDNVSILGNIPYGSWDWVSIYDLTFVTAYTWLSLYFSVWRMDEVAWVWAQYYLSRNATSTVLTNCDIAYKWAYMAGNLRWRFWLVDSNVQIDCDDYDWLTVWVNNWLLFNSIQSTGRSKIVYNGKTYNTNNSTQPVFSVAWESYGYDMHINILDFRWTAALVSTASSINANIYCTGNYWSSTTNWFSELIRWQQSLTNPSASTIPLKIYVWTTVIENLNNVTKATIAWYGTWNSVLWLLFWANAVITSKVIRSLKNEIIWVDHNNPQTIDDQAMWVIEIYWTKLERLWRDVWAWYDWVIFIDTWWAIDTIQDNTIKLYNWVSFINLWDTFAIAWFNASATNSIPTIEYYDDIYTNWLTNNVTYFEKYMHKPSKTITAWDLVAWVYTVKAYENDLYADIATLWSFTLAIWDPAKFVNRELSIKVTSTHPTNTITVDPAGAALIDGSATYVVPNTSTWRTNIVTKSDWTARRIK